MKPLCFVIMPFGKKPDATGKIIDFDYVYTTFIKKVLDVTGLTPIRADEEMIGGIIHKPMYERLLLCDFAIADLSAANANVFYELGVRYTAKPHTTFSIFESETKIPFDLVDVRCFPYTLESGKIKDLDEKINQLTTYINANRKGKQVDSPIYQLLDGIEFKHNLSHEKVELLRTQTEYNESVRADINNIVESSVTKEEKAVQLSALEEKLGDKNDWQVGIGIDMLLAYRSVECYTCMVKLIESFPAFLKKTVLMQEQYGFALNRADKKKQAIEVLQKLIDENGPTSETCGILGRVYKDMYTSQKDTNAFLAAGYLDKAIATYMMGYKADMRDFYPGVNAVNLMFIKKDPAAKDLAKVVEFSVNTYLERKEKTSNRNIASSYDDYWPHATLLELAVLQGEKEKAIVYLMQCLTAMSEPWQRTTTINNLKMYNGGSEWVKEIIAQLGSQL